MMVNVVNGGCKNLPPSSGVKRGRNKCYATDYEKAGTVCFRRPKAHREQHQSLPVITQLLYKGTSRSTISKSPKELLESGRERYYSENASPSFQRRNRNVSGAIPRDTQRDTFGNAVVHQPNLPICNVPANKREVTFTGPFSIDSILKGDLKVMQSTCLKARLPYEDDARCALTSLKPVSGYSTTDLYSFKSLGCEIDTLKSSLLLTGSHCGLTVSSQAFDDCVLHSNYCSSTQIYASTRYAGW